MGAGRFGPNRIPTVMIVDDEESLRAMMRQILEGAGYQVCEADEGFQALSLLLQGRQVDVVVTDIRMPRMDGCELATHMAALTPGVPILFVSGFLTELEPSALSWPVLAKPFVPEQLVASVRQAHSQHA